MDSTTLDKVRSAVGRPGVHSLSQVIPKDFKKWYSQLPCLALSIKKRDGVNNKPASLLVVSLGKTLNGTLPPLCGRQVAYPYFTGLSFVKLLTQHIVKGGSWVFTCGSPPCWWWGYQPPMIGSKWTAIFTLA